MRKRSRLRIGSAAMRSATIASLALAAPAALTAQDLTFPLQAQAETIVGGVSGDWGVMAWSVDRGEPLFSIGANDVLVPASNNKVFTSIWALDLLGADHRFPTDLLVTGTVSRGVLRGDVVLRGSGDPAFGNPEYDQNPRDPLVRMAERLKGLGIRAIEGDVIGDPFAFDTVLVGPEWPGDTGGGAAFYAPRVSGLPFQRNVVYVRPERVSGGPPVIRLEPPVDVVPVVIGSSSGRARAVRRPDQDTIRVMGSISGRGPYRFPVGVADPALLTAGALHSVLREAGIQVGGQARVGRTPENARVVHRHYSVPLGHMLPKLNQDSDNFFAEHLWKAAVAEAVGVGSYREGGPAGALHFMRRAGVPPGHMYQFDGSGLSSLNRATANSLVRALVYAHEQPYSEVFHESMAVAADPKGTMRRLFRNTPAAGNLHAKTGYISRVRALSGYVRAGNGELIVFSFLYNGGNTSGARGAQSELGALLAGYGARPEADGN